MNQFIAKSGFRILICEKSIKIKVRWNQNIFRCQYFRYVLVGTVLLMGGRASSTLVRADKVFLKSSPYSYQGLNDFLEGYSGDSIPPKCSDYFHRPRIPPHSRQGLLNPPMTTVTIPRYQTYIQSLSLSFKKSPKLLCYFFLHSMTLSKTSFIPSFAHCPPPLVLK
jgi:hypothetical protein